MYIPSLLLLRKKKAQNALQACICFKILFVYDIYKYDPQNDKVVPLKEMKDSHGVV